MSIIKGLAVSALAAVLFMAPPHPTEAETGRDEIDITKIPLELIPDADAIIREDVRVFEYRRAGQGRMEVRQVITVMNSDGRDYGEFVLHYNQFSNVSRINGAIYDSQGERVKRLRNRDIEDSHAYDGISIIQDSRYKSFELYHSTYPYTIEVEYRIDYSGFINLPSFSPQSSNTSVQYGRFELILPTDQNISSVVLNLENKEPEVIYQGNQRTKVWEINNAPVVEREPYGPSWVNLLPLILVSSDDFNMDGYTGSMRSWEDFGKWIYSLWEGRNEINDETRAVVQQITSEYDDPHDIIRELYRYIQQNTRYVSIQLGIGGFQTETAERTQRNRYGDCKALSNLLQGMLTEAGIKSYPALIRNGSGLMAREDFVFNSFNHAIVFIPLEQDTVWVEATSSQLPPGYIGSGNSNRNALVFNSEGGKLVRTPAYTPEQNYQLREASVILEPNGNATAEIHTRYGGTQHDRVRHYSSLASGPLSRTLHGYINLTRFDITSHDVGASLLEPEAWISLNMDISSYSRSMGNRLFFNPNMLESFRGQVQSTEERKQPVYQRQSYYDVDEITYQLPAGYQVEALPEDITLETSFGYYETTYDVDEENRTLTFRRTIKLSPVVLPPEEFDIFRDFHNTIPRHDSAQVVLVRE